MKNMSDPLVPSIFTMTDEFKEKILEKAAEFPQAFAIKPVAVAKLKSANGNWWAKYHFDESVNLWVDPSHEEAINLYKQQFSEEKERKMTTALTVTEKTSVKALLASNIKAIQSVLPKHLTPEKMLRMAYTAVVLTPKLARCSQLSLLNAVIEASAIGLEIGGPLAQAHLLPFKNKGQLEAKLIPDYKGLIKLAYQSPGLKSFTARPVYSKDVFDYWYGLKPDLIHTPYKGGDRGDLVAAYAIVIFTSGGSDFEVVEPQDAMAAKDRSPAKNSEFSPWNSKADEWSMWVKTAVKKLLKRVPLSSDLQRALTLDLKPGEPQELEHVIEADFKRIEDPKEPVKEEKAKQPEKKTETKKNKEMQNITTQFNVTRDDFPDEYLEALKELGIPGDSIIKFKDMKPISDKISVILDRKLAIVNE